MVPSVKCLTLDFCSGHELRVVRASPTSGFCAGGPALDSFSLPPPPHLPLMLACPLSLSLNMKNKINHNFLVAGLLALFSKFTS